jgi:flagellin-like hook-associated protein FlgL
MTMNGVNVRTSHLGLSLLNMRQRLDDLQAQLATGKVSDTYAGMGVSRGLGVGLRAQLNELAGFADTIANTNLRINVGSSVLTRMYEIGTETRSGALKGPVDLDANGQTTSQRGATAAFTEVLQLLNTRAGDRYLFSGRAVDQPAVASPDDIMYGVGGQAGLKQLITERLQADKGASGLGRVVISSPSVTSVAVAEDAVGSPFGFKLAGATTTLTGATITGPAGAPPAMSVDLGAVNPNVGEKVRFSFTLPDGTTETIELTATTTTPLPPDSFAIGVDTTATAANLNAALTSAMGELANTALVAASAMEAADNFFSSSPPLRVSGVPLNTATALVAGTPADTVTWYIGETGADPARGTAVSRVDQSITAQYGMRANEEGLRWQLQNIAVYAAVTTAAGPDATNQIVALNTRIVQNMSTQSGQQSIENIQAELSGAQNAIAAAKERQTQTKSMVETLLDQIEGVTNEEVATKILALQTNLQASYQTTAMLYQLSLVNYV